MPAIVLTRIANVINKYFDADCAGHPMYPSTVHYNKSTSLEYRKVAPSRPYLLNRKLWPLASMVMVSPSVKSPASIFWASGFSSLC